MGLVYPVRWQPMCPGGEAVRRRHPGGSLRPVRVLVTGASGFVGRFTTAELLGRGHEVLALVRRPGSEPAGARPVHGDLLDAGSLSSALGDAAPECVVHLAAEIGTQRDAARLERVNVEGMANFIGACQASGGAKVVFCSTVVTGNAGGRVLDEATPLPVQTPYGASKQRGEAMLSESGLELAIIRPGHIYGPGGWYAKEIVARLRQPGRIAVVGRGQNWWDPVHVEDVARALSDAVERAVPGTLLHCADDEPLTYYDFVAATATELGVGAPRRLPAAIARLVAGSGPVATLTRSARTSNRRLKAELGWSPRWPSSAAGGIAHAVAALGATP